MKRTRHSAVFGMAGLLLAGCSLTPPLQTPQVALPAAYRETAPWAPAEPADQLARDDWWGLYGNQEIEALQHRLLDGSPSLAAALANYQQAKAFSDEARAGLFPNVGMDMSALRQRNSGNVANPVPHPTFDTNTLGISASYEFDLWGRIRNEVAVGEANSAAAAADLENARLSLEAELVDDYIQLRSLDKYRAILDQTVKAYERALQLTEQRRDVGIAPDLDVAQARTQLDSTRSQVERTAAQRALIEHAIAALIGMPASTFSISPAIVDIPLPRIPVGVPSSLLQRRPDIAAAERRMEAANADIGAARTAFFPMLTLGAGAGYQSSRFGNLFSAPSAIWAIGPSAFLTLFDGGLRRARVAQAHAEFDVASAHYRGTVLAAFEQVEDNLALLDHYGAAAVTQKSAVDAARHSLDLASALYNQGATDYLTVVSTQTTVLKTQLDALDLETLRLRASVALIRALGGGWSDRAAAKPAA